jgi:molecular chaperone DnaK (HSP70)
MPMVAHALAAEFGVTPQLHDPDLAVAKGAALRAHQIVAAAGAVGAPSTGLASARPLASVVPRSFGLLVADSFEASGQRRFVQHVIHQNDPLPVDAGEWTVGTILDDQHTVRIEVYEQAGAVESAELADNRRVLDGELSGLPRRLPAGAPIRVTLRLGLDGRLSVTAVEPSSGATLALEACIEGVLDTAGRDRLATQLGRLAVRQ